MVVFLTNIPTPYRVPLFNLIADDLEQKGEEFHVLFAMPTYGKRAPWAGVLQQARFQHSVMDFPKVMLGYDAVLFLPYNVAGKIEPLKPTCLVVSGFNLMAMLAARYARQREIPYIIWSGGTDAEFEGLSAQTMRTFIRRKLVRDAAGFIAYGSRASSHLQSLGADPAKISIGINSVDTDFFGRQVAELKGVEDARPDTPVRVLYVGHLQQRKGLDWVLRALAEVGDSRIQLDVVGNGPQREEYEALAGELGLRSVRFWGYKGKEELPEFYAGADIFVFPSIEEVFGLVAVEAAAAGLPILASTLAGGTPDVVEDGRNGYIIDPRNVDEFAARLAELSSDPARRKKMGEESLRIVADRVNIHRSAEGFVEAIMRCSRGGVKKEVAFAR